MTESARLALPLLEPGQAQKEWWHNEALTLLDIAVQPVVEGISDAPPQNPMEGRCWIVGAGASGAWAGRAGTIAGWTPGGWRFLPAREEFAAWNIAVGTVVRRRGDAWIADRSPPIAAPAGGAIVDAEARATIAAILAAMTARGWLA